MVVSGYIGIPSHDFNNVFDFQCIAASDANALQNIGPSIVPAMLQQIYEPIKGWISAMVMVNHVSLRDPAMPQEGYDWLGSYFPGEVSGTPLPPFVTYSVELQRSNYAIRNGRKGIPGPVIAALDANGDLNSTARSFITNALATWIDGFNVETGGGAEYTFALRIAREPEGPEQDPSVWSNVSGVACRKFGTQNSRK